MRIAISLVVLAFTVASTGATGAYAAGDVITGLDPTFGTGGTATVGFDGAARGNAVAVQSDGGVVVAGYTWVGADLNFAVARLTPNGSIDASFGDNGRVVTPVSRYSVPTDVEIQPDGKIVVGGYAFIDTGPFTGGYRFVVVRYNSNGALDPTFGSGGIVTTDVGDLSAFGFGLVLQGDGKIVLVGQTYNYATQWDFGVVRYNADGSLDTAFDGDGILTTSISTAARFSMDFAQAGTLQPDGKLIVVGRDWGFVDDFAVVRYNGDGSLDTSFSGDGRVIVDLGAGYDLALAASVRGDGDIVVAGFAQGNLGIVRPNGDGTLDTGFDGDGIVVSPSSGFGYGTNIVIQPDGKFLVPGSILASEDPEDFLYGYDYDMSIQRYNSDGTPDATFGVNGVLQTDFAMPGVHDPGSYDVASDVAVQPDGKVIAAGTSGLGTAGTSFFAVARYSDKVDPLFLIDQLLAGVNSLQAAGALNQGEGRSLRAKLMAARARVEDNGPVPAANQLAAFVNEVDALIRSRRLSSPLGQPLIDEANAIVALLAP